MHVPSVKLFINTFLRCPDVFYPNFLLFLDFILSLNHCYNTSKDNLLVRNKLQSLISSPLDRECKVHHLVDIHS